MPLIWAAISAHGFGHAAQVVPVLNALGRLVPNLRALLRTKVPSSFFRDRLAIPWDISPVQQDVGCIQNGPLTIDVEATWLEHDRFHATWADRMQAEIEAMRVARPNLILADTPYLAIAAGSQAAIPTVALVSFTWDLVLSDYLAPPHLERQLLIQSIRRAYARADFALRINPSPKMEVFDRIIEVGAIVDPVPSARDELARHLNLAPGERTVLVGFGGVSLNSLPFERLEQLMGHRFLYDGPIPPEITRVVSTRSLPFPFPTLLASVDIIMTKPGYSTLVQAVASQTPLVYVRRYNFADEQPLVEYLHRHGRGVELTLDDFVQGRWEPALQHILTASSSLTPPPPATGATDSAIQLAKFFSHR